MPLSYHAGFTRLIPSNQFVQQSHSTRIPSAFGASAADLESDLVYSILTSNPLMGDGVALFNAGQALLHKLV